MLPQNVIHVNHPCDIDWHEPHAYFDKVTCPERPVIFFVEDQQCFRTDRQCYAVVDADERYEDECDRIQSEHLRKYEEQGYEYDCKCCMTCYIMVCGETIHD